MSTLKEIASISETFRKYLGMETPNRDFLVLFNTSLHLGFEWFTYNALDRDVRYVPPHPDDQGALTSPIEVPDETDSDTSEGYFDLELDVSLSFVLWESFFLKYQFGIGGGLGQGSTGEGRYDYPPQPRQPYDSGENAFTFITVNGQPIFANYISLGYFAPMYGKPFPYEDGVFNIEAGALVRTYTLMRGWDRYASVEEMDTVFVNSWGGFAGVTYKKLFFEGNSVFFSVSIGIKFFLSEFSQGILADFSLLPMFGAAI